MHKNKTEFVALQQHKVRSKQQQQLTVKNGPIREVDTLNEESPLKISDKHMVFAKESEEQDRLILAGIQLISRKIIELLKIVAESESGEQMFLRF